MKKTKTIPEQLSSPHVVAMVRGWIKENKNKGRHALASYLCEELDLRDRFGNPRLAGVQKALRMFEAQGLWCLPGHQRTPPRKWNPRRTGRPIEEPRDVPGRAEDVRGLELIEVKTEDDAHFRIWNELMLTEHPLQDCRLVGRQLRYLIYSDHGWLGGIGFGSCALRLTERDRWMGWDDETRNRFQERLINMTRFLIRPSVRCANLASTALSMCMERVGRDFSVYYGFEPWLVESFVDREQYSGTCYRAANWQCVGATQGTGWKVSKRKVTTRKDIYLYELRRDWQRRMGITQQPEEITAVDLEEAVKTESWVDDEFSNVDLGHSVTEQRLVHIARSKAQNPSASYTECYAGDRHQLKAYYRFIGNEREQISPEGILAGHRKRTVGRMKGRKRVLVIQDSTELDFSERLHCNGLGDIGKNQTGAMNKGLRMHSSLAVSEEGLPLGVLHTQIYARHFGEEAKDKHRPIEQKESYRWLRTVEELGQLSASVPQSELICVGDRESDIFELFDYRRRRARSVHLLVRARYNRCLEEESLKLFEHLRELSVAGKAKIQVPRQREKKSKPSKPGQISLPARTAHVELKWDKVTIAAPQTPQTKRLRPVELHALLVSEPNSPKGARPLHWVLLTTVPIHSRKQALRCLRWYTLRWRIEEWHRVLKSGCHIEAHQHQSAEKLARAIAIDTVIAWRVMLLTLLGREVPEIPCNLVFSPWECKLLERLQPIVAPETLEGQKRGAYASERHASS